MKSDRPVLFLDVDGTIAPITADPTRVDAYLYDVPDLDPMSGVGYRHDVVERIQGLHDRGVVEVRWLTTWGPGMVQAWHRRGIGPFSYAPGDTEQGLVAGISAKAKVVRAWLDLCPDTRAIWADDHAAPGWMAGYGPERLLVVAPQPDRGLTHAHVDGIEAFCEAAADGRRRAASSVRKSHD